jgi:hypothetical protein
MNAQPDPLGHQATTTINAELALLLRMTEQMPEVIPGIHQHLQSLANRIESVQLAIARIVFALTSVDDGTEGLLDLLQHAEGNPVQAHHLTGLLTPLHLQVQYASSESNHLLYQLLDDSSAHFAPRSKPSS